MDRATLMARLTGSRERYDLLVIGGGITGAGVAREAALRGLRVVLLEARDFANATSSRSTKLIHGGLRYLKNLEFRLVRESVRERQHLLSMAPHLVKPTPFLFPVWSGDPDPLWQLNLGLTLYDWFAGSANPMRHRMHSPRSVLALEPGLRGDGLQGGALYSDSRTDDGRLTLAVIQSAVQHGALALNYAAAEKFLRGAGGLIIGVVVRDVLSGATFPVQADHVLAAAGPWADAVRDMDGPGQDKLLRLTKGVHLTLPFHRLPITHCVVMRGSDGRMMFAVPAGTATYVGTTDTDHERKPDQLMVTRPDVDYVLEATRRTFPEARIAEGDIIGTWAGLRPLLRSEGSRQNPSRTSRDYKLFHARSGLVSVAGGKLTAFRAMAEHIVDDLFPATRSDHQPLSIGPLPGAQEPLPGPAELRALATETGTAEEVVADLAHRYGSAVRQVAAEWRELARTESTGSGESPEVRWLRARLRHGVKAEMAVRLVDFLQRRTELMLFTRGNGEPYVELLAAEMGEMLGWNGERREAEIAECRREIAAMFAWR